MAAPPIEFWFDFASSYSYPAAMRVDAAAAALGARVEWRPFLLGPLFTEQQGIKDSPFNVHPLRGQHMWRDLERVCAKYGLEWRRPSAFPSNSLLAARTALALAREPWAPDFSRAVFRANFAEGLDIASRDVLGTLLRRWHSDPAAAFQRAESDENKAALRDQTAEAARRGIFGAPNFFVGREHFFGQDRLDDALSFWSKQAGLLDLESAFRGTGRTAAREFAEAWLPTWTGGDPEPLLAFYTDDVFYADPAVPQGLRGKDALRSYFQKVLPKNPAWTWTHIGSEPMEGGFVNRWRAHIPTGSGATDCEGVCLVWLRGQRICRNEVFFDRSELQRATKGQA